MTTNTPTPTSNLTHREMLINDFTVSPVSLGDLARAHRMSIPGLAQWAGAPVNRRALDAIRDLSDARTELIVSHARTEAAHQLRKLAAESESAETQRKACVDLLRLGAAPAPVRARSAKGAPGEASPDAEADRDTAQRLLEALANHGAAGADDVTEDGDTPAEHAA